VPSDALAVADRGASLAPSASIEIEGAREHNLKDVSVRIPRDALVVVTGPSGSGKSTLAFDIVFAEGQRRYVESLSAYARQFVGQLPRPDVDRVTGIPPTVAIEQRTTRGGSRSTVATQTEIAHCACCSRRPASRTAPCARVRSRRGTRRRSTTASSRTTAARRSR
jgi:excinuclease ABC subunit A